MNILLLDQRVRSRDGRHRHLRARNRRGRQPARRKGHRGGARLRAADRKTTTARLPFEIVRFRGGLHSDARSCRARSCWRAAASAAIDTMWSMPPIGRSSFRVALSRWRTPARVLMTVHGTEINETQTPLKRMAIRGAGVFGPRTEVIANSRIYRDAVPRAVCRRCRQRSARSIWAYRISGSARNGSAATVRAGLSIWRQTGW